MRRKSKIDVEPLFRAERHWSPDKMATILQTTFSITCSWTKGSWKMILRAQLSTRHHWFMHEAIRQIDVDQYLCRHVASLSHNGFRYNSKGIHQEALSRFELHVNPLFYEWIVKIIRSMCIHVWIDGNTLAQWELLNVDIFVEKFSRFCKWKTELRTIVSRDRIFEVTRTWCSIVFRRSLDQIYMKYAWKSWLAYCHDFFNKHTVGNMLGAMSGPYPR